jgi:hypothetical protein
LKQLNNSGSGGTGKNFPVEKPYLEAGINGESAAKKRKQGKQLIGGSGQYNWKICDRSRQNRNGSLLFRRTSLILN